ncbi:MAG: glycoside hydrolase family 3 N-terminal domain-containing protein [Bryobacteraceae bacterium]
MRFLVAALLLVVPIPAATKAEQKAAQSILNSLTLRERVAQLIFGVAYGDAPAANSKDGQRFRHWVKDLRIGGFIVVNRLQYGLARNAEPHTMALFLNQMQKLSKVPLLVGADFERGASMRVSDTIKFPFNMAYAAARDSDASRYEGLAAAREARALGVHWIFAPVSDVNNNPANPVINIRSFGENPEDVAMHVSSFIEGAHSDPKNPVLVSAKHFPGHGDTDVDSHLDLAHLSASRDRMDEVELVPFKAAIAHGVDSIMTAHMTVPAMEPEDIPATVSKRVLTGVLREELGFKGLIVTDSMEMKGLTKQFKNGEAAVRAVEAGADVLLMPPDPDAVVRALIAAVNSGRIPKKRIDQSVQRILEAKVHVGITKKKMVDLDAITESLDLPEEGDRAQTIADRAVTLIRNEGDVVPLKTPEQACVIASVGVRLSTFGQRLADEFHRRQPNARVVFIDNGMNEAALEAQVGDTSACSAIVFATYTLNTKLSDNLSALVTKLTEGTVPVVLAAFGNPYLVADFPKVAAYMPAFSTAPPSEASVVKALLGEIATTGKLPITIPDFARYGDGIEIERK